MAFCIIKEQKHTLDGGDIFVANLTFYVVVVNFVELINECKKCAKTRWARLEKK